jgi:hypothetical protein
MKFPFASVLLVLSIVFPFPSAALSTTLSEKDVEVIESIYEFFLEVKGIHKYIKTEAFPTWKNDTTYYVDQSMSRFLEKRAVEAFEELGSLMGLSISQVDDPDKASIVLIISEKYDEDLTIQGRWGTLLSKKIPAQKNNPLYDIQSEMNCGSRSIYPNYILDFSLASVIYDKQAFDPSQNPFLGCMRSSIFSAMGIRIRPSYMDSIFSSIKNAYACYSKSDKTFLKILYRSEFTKFIDNEISGGEFKKLIYEIYEKQPENSSLYCK